VIDLDHLRELLLDEDSDAAKRFYGMGFSLERFDLIEDEDYDYMRVRGRFVCVCGRREQIQGIFAKDLLEHEELVEHVAQEYNIYRMLQRAGSMSRDHLLKDGYTPEQIDDMEARYQRSLETA
jgi:hypothetical protein